VSMAPFVAQMFAVVTTVDERERAEELIVRCHGAWQHGAARFCSPRLSPALSATVNANH